MPVVGLTIPTVAKGVTPIIVTLVMDIPVHVVRARKVNICVHAFIVVFKMEISSIVTPP
jgi:hypothetical protein